MNDEGLPLQKKIEPHPDHAAYVRQWVALYDDKNYASGLTGYFLKKSHALSESRFGPDVHFSKVLEVGAGTGIHSRYVVHSFDEYYLTDLNPPMMEKISLSSTGRASGKIIVAAEDATSLSFADDTFDRVIAAHVLEHLYRPHEVLLEWGRVLKPGGTMTLVLPCDPGALWRLGRFAIARKKFIRAGFLYDYWMAREHVNSINNLVAFVRHYFSNVHEEWLPLRIPSIDLNLFYVAHIRV